MNEKVFGAFIVIAAIIAGCGGSKESSDPVFSTPPDNIYTAAKAGNVEAVKGFITDGKWDPASPDDTGTTPLNYAAANGNVEIIRIMVEHGANPNQIDIHKNTPLKVAEKAGKTDAVAVLKELGATQ